MTSSPKTNANPITGNTKIIGPEKTKSIPKKGKTGKIPEKEITQKNNTLLIDKPNKNLDRGHRERRNRKIKGHRQLSAINEKTITSKQRTAGETSKSSRGVRKDRNLKIPGDTKEMSSGTGIERI